MSKKKQKIPFKTPEQKRAENNSNLMNTIISETFARHADISEEEFLKKIGFAETGKTEDEAIRIAMFNVMVVATRELLNLEGKINMANGLFRTYMLEEGIAEQETEEESKNNESEGE